MSGDTPDSPPPAPGPAPARPTRFVVLAILNFLSAAGSALWATALLVGVASANAAGFSGGGMMTVSTVATINVAHVVLLVAGGVGLLRSARWGWYATIGFGVLAIGEALILLSTQAPPTFVVARLVYPVIALGLLTAPIARKAVGF